MRKAVVLLAGILFIISGYVLAGDWCWNSLSNSEWNLNDEYKVVFQESVIGPSPMSQIDVIDDDNVTVWSGIYKCKNGVVTIFDNDWNKIAICVVDQTDNVLHCFEEEIGTLEK